MREQILYYAWKYQGNWNKIANAISKKEQWEIIQYDGNYITIVDEHYPNCLKELNYAPWILFYEGNLSYIQDELVSVVGSRIMSSYGEKMCSLIVNQLKKKYVIVSGLAKGIDACAHRNAMDHKTIAVIGNGIDMTYPKENDCLYENIKKNHLLISEYPNGTLPLNYHFPWRNRIIAALGSSLIVVEAKLKSGTMLSVNEAITLDKPIYVVPYRYDDISGKGCNLLISQGANILIDEMDLENI
ncbi:MAG: DNA-processing protein DprA [Erysipelotrichaceae bacterium]